MKTKFNYLPFFLISLMQLNAQISVYPSVKWEPSVRVSNSNNNSTIKYNQVEKENELPSSYDEPVQSIKSESRVVGYYEEGFGASATWHKISLKITIVTNQLGYDEITVIAYLNDSGFWINVSYGGVSKTFGDKAKEFSYQSYVSSKIVYFNI